MLLPNAARPAPAAPARADRQERAGLREEGRGGESWHPGIGPAGKGKDGKGQKIKEKEGAGGDDLLVPSPLAGAPVRNSISIFYEK